jgi:ATP-binding cassette, subfamily A (ABC1), member 1
LTMNLLYNNLFDDKLNVGAILSVQLVWSIIYLPITWYLEKILPGHFGVPLPFNFIFKKNYWFPVSIKVIPQSKDNLTNNKPGFDQEPSNLKATVQIKCLTKVFNKIKRAVDDLSINFYEGQVTTILGHNGAGKTTTTMLLCGIYSPTTGTANIMGLDLRKDMDRIRSIIGFCPQYDIIFNEFNVFEHLKLIAWIKGYPNSEINDEIKRISTYVGLHKDLQKKAKNLSGGMKRRLMIASALVGDSKVIILDEPTSGLDPYNRRIIWELVRKYKMDRTIILTTHFMEGKLISKVNHYLTF